MPRKSAEEMIEELALSVARGFEEVRQDVSHGFAEVHRRLDQIESKVTGLAGRVEVLEDIVRMVRTKLSL